MTTYADDTGKNETALGEAGASDWLLWLDLEADGAATATERRRIEQVLADQPSRASERDAAAELHRLLASSSAVPTIDVAPDFVARVMDNLPEPEWQRRSASERAGSAAWQLPFAAMIAFVTIAVFLLSGAESALLGTGAALADFFATTALAGAGLLEASWRGIGWGLRDLFVQSPATVAAMAGLVLGLDVLFVSLLLRRKARPAVETSAAANDD